MHGQRMCRMHADAACHMFTTQILPPSGVTHAAAAFFTHGQGAPSPLPDLLVARSTQLELYSCRWVAGAGPDPVGVEVHIVYYTTQWVTQWNHSRRREQDTV